VRRCRCADYVVLNKTDLLKEGELEQLQAIVASLNPFATARTVPAKSDSSSSGYGVACVLHVRSYLQALTRDRMPAVR
jgi:G3E family GTPase